MSKKLTPKKLDAEISKIYTRLAENRSINILDIGKVYKAGRDAYTATGTLEAVEAALATAVATYCK